MGTDLFHADGQTHRRADRETDRQTDMKKLMVVFVIMGTRLKTPEICDVLFRIQSSVFMVFRGSLPLLSPRLDVPTFATRCLHVRNDARDPSSERWNYVRERFSGNFAYMASLFTPLGIFYMPKIYDMGPTALLPL